MIAIILAGGFGTRLKSVVKNVPKPMAPINGKPYLEYLISYLKKNGINKIVLCVHYQYQIIIDYFGNNFQSIKIDYVIEKEPLGTGGAILNAITQLNLENNSLFILNGDTFIDLDYQQLKEIHQQRDANLTITAYPMEDCSRYGKININDNIITDFTEKNASSDSGYINAGVYCLKSSLLLNYQNKLPHNFSFEREFLYPYCSIIKPMAYIHQGFFIDIGIPEDYYRACRLLPTIS